MIFSDATAPDQPGRDTQAEKRKSQQARTARTAEATTIGEGEFRVHSGAVILVEDGGDIIFTDGGSLFVRGTGGVTLQDGAVFVAEYPDSGRVSTFVGHIVSGDATIGHGLLIQGDSTEKPDILLAYENTAGERLVTVGFPAAVVDRFKVYADEAHVFADDFYAEGDTQAQMLSFGGQVAIGGTGGTLIMPESTGLAANVHMDVNGRVFRSTSSRRYKTDIQDATVDPDVVLQLRPRTWLPGSIPACCPDWLHEQHGDGRSCPADQDPEPPDLAARRQVGFVAEELVELGLDAFVEFNADGEPEAIYYDRLTAALVPLLQRQQQQIQQLTDRVAALEGEPDPTTGR